MIVVDTSIAIAWCLADEESEIAGSALERVSAEGGAAPGHWPLEVANALLTAERRGRLDAAGVADASRLLDRLSIEIVPVELPTATRSVLDLARQQQLTAYDAAYLDLARFRDVPLATLDDRLRAAARLNRVDVLD